jgi:hypothetical protein
MLLIFLSSCQTTQYVVEVTYANGDKETIVILTDYKPHLHNGCLSTDDRTVRCAVRSFITLDKQIYKEQ